MLRSKSTHGRPLHFFLLKASGNRTGGLLQLSVILEVTRSMAACLYVLERRWNRAGGTKIKKGLNLRLRVITRRSTTEPFTYRSNPNHMAHSSYMSFEKGGMAGVVTLNFAD